MDLKKSFIAPFTAIGLLTACETLPQQPEVQAYSTESILAVNTETREKTELLREFSAWKDEIEQYAQSIKNPEKSAHENMEAIIQYADEQGVKYHALAQFLKKRIQTPTDWFQSFIEFGYFPNFYYHTDKDIFLHPIRNQETYSLTTLSPQLAPLLSLDPTTIFFVNTPAKWTSRSLNDLVALNINQTEHRFMLFQNEGFSMGEKTAAQEAEIIRRMSSSSLSKAPHFLTSYNWEDFSQLKDIKTGLESNQQASKFLVYSSAIQKNQTALYTTIDVVLSNIFIHQEKPYSYDDDLNYIHSFIAKLFTDRGIDFTAFTKTFEDTVTQNHKGKNSEQKIQLSDEEEKLLQTTIISLLKSLSPEEFVAIQEEFQKESQRIIDFMKTNYKPLYKPEWVDEQRFQITDKFPKSIEAQSEKEKAIDIFVAQFNDSIKNTKPTEESLKNALLEQLRNVFPEDIQSFENVEDDTVFQKKIQGFFAQYNYHLNFDYQEEKTDFFIKAHAKVDIPYSQFPSIKKLFPELPQDQITLFIFQGKNDSPMAFQTGSAEIMGLNLSSSMSYYNNYYDHIPNIPPWVSHGIDESLRSYIAHELTHRLLLDKYGFLLNSPGLSLNFQGKRLEITAMQTHEFLASVSTLETFAEMEVFRVINNSLPELHKKDDRYSVNKEGDYGFTNIFMIEKLREIMKARGENIDPILDEIVASNIFLEQHPEIKNMPVSNESKKRDEILTKLLRKIKKIDIAFLQAHYLAWGKDFMKVIKANKK